MENTTITPEIRKTAKEMAAAFMARKSAKSTPAPKVEAKAEKKVKATAPKAEKKPKAEKAPVADPSRTTLKALSKRFAAAGIDCEVHGQDAHIFFKNAQKGDVELEIHRVNAKSVSEWMKLAEDWAKATPTE